MEKELAELNKILDKIIGKVEKPEEDNKQKIQNIKKAQKKIKEQLELENEVVIFGNQNGSLCSGQAGDILATLATLINNLMEDIPLEIMTQTVVMAIACKDNTEEIKIDRDKLNEVLEAIKELL